ncbi:MAG: hypothetical protein GX119_09470 [Syntrophomonadaceae bacterium]|jgi:hypothetical protein|nr:hypothetical protein [Syntrophomonadaceae bacterium]
MVEISILISSFCRPHLLKWNLYSLAQQNIPFSFETIVLNDGIPDLTFNICEQFTNTLHLKYVFTGYRNEKGLVYRVPGFALNIGARISRGNILIISCAEMFHINNTIELLAEPVLFEPTLLATSIGMDDQDGSFLQHLEQKHGAYNAFDYYNYPTLNTTLPFLMALSRQEFFAIGGYDEDFVGFAYDDNDLMDRLHKKGCRLCLTQAQTVHLYHERHDTGKEQTPEYLLNASLYRERRGKILRNESRDWGTIKYYY